MVWCIINTLSTISGWAGVRETSHFLPLGNRLVPSLQQIISAILKFPFHVYRPHTFLRTSNLLPPPTSLWMFEHLWKSQQSFTNDLQCIFWESVNSRLENDGCTHMGPFITSPYCLRVLGTTFCFLKKKLLFISHPNNFSSSSFDGKHA